MPTPIPHSFLRLNRRGGRGSRLVDFSFKNESNENAGVFLTLIETTEKVNNLKKLEESNDYFRDYL